MLNIATHTSINEQSVGVYQSQYNKEIVFNTDKARKSVPTTNS